MSAKKNRRMPTDEAAAYLGYKPATLRAWRVRGGGPDYEQPRGAGGKTMYRLAALIVWKRRNGARA